METTSYYVMGANQVSATAERLRKALALFGPNGEKWVNRLPGNNEYCSVTACAEADPTTSFLSATDLLCSVVGLGEFEVLQRWNDAPERTWPEVKAAFEKAIELAEASR